MSDKPKSDLMVIKEFFQMTTAEARAELGPLPADVRKAIADDVRALIEVDDLANA